MKIMNRLRIKGGKLMGSRVIEVPEAAKERARHRVRRA